jgi:hypothetical protein
VNAARYSLVADIRDVDLPSPCGSPLTGFIAQSCKRTARKARDGATWSLPIAAMDKCDCQAGNALIIMPGADSSARATARST